MASLKTFAKELSERYRKNIFPYITCEEHRQAYLATRMPATQAAISHVLATLEDQNITSFLDVGAGPGTGMSVVKEFFPSISKITLLEKDKGFISIGKKLFPEQGEWIFCDIEKNLSPDPHDLVLASYVLGELNEAIQLQCAETLWKCANKLLILIEPGTPLGFARILRLRNHLLALGAHIVAPCPHAHSCPMAQGDWCHFSQRLPRTSQHRLLKEGSLGYEDEKFSYLVFSKIPSQRSGVRILRHPVIRPGNISLTLCAESGIKNKIISKKEGNSFKKAKKAKWGDLYNELGYN